MIKFTAPGGASRLNPGLIAHIDAKRVAREEARGLVHALLAEQSQPVTVAEMTELLAREALGIAATHMTVRHHLTALVAGGLAASRRETPAERALRTPDGGLPAGPAAELFFAGETVPPRTVAEAVAGVVLRRHPGRGPAKKRRAARKVVPAKTAARAVTADALNFLIDQLVTDRTAEIRRQLDATAARADAAEARAERLEAQAARVRRAVTGD